MKRPKKMPSIHPGEVLLEDFLKPLGISQFRLAKDLKVPPRRINEIVHGTRSITADTALRLSRYFGTTDRLWVNMQAKHDLEVEKDRLETGLREKSPSSPVRVRLQRGKAPGAARLLPISNW